MDTWRSAQDGPRGWALVDGKGSTLREATIPVDDPAVTHGWSVFEALLVRDGEPQRPRLHLARLAGSCRAALIDLPDEAVLVDEVRRVGEQLGGLVRVRITLTGGGRRVVTGEIIDASVRNRPVRAVRGPDCPRPFLGGSVKHGSRAPWVVAVRRAGVDEMLLVGEDDRFTEGTTCAVLAVCDGVVLTAPHDGRILPSTTTVKLLARAEALGVPVERIGPLAAGPWDGLYIASTTRHLAPVIELDGQSLPCWEPVGRRLAELER